MHYPMVLVACWTLATVNRVHLYAAGPAPAWLSASAVVAGNLNGFANALVYGCNPKVRRYLWLD